MPLRFGTLRQWHWISSAICLAGMLLFAITGLTLNHASWSEAPPRTESRQAQLPDSLQQALLASPPSGTALPAVLRQWLEDTTGQALGQSPAEWSGAELYLSLPRPGGDAWLSLDVRSGRLEYENTDLGWLAYLNDLHKGRHTGVIWQRFIDLVAIACLVFCLTGLLLLLRQTRYRPATGPLLGLGLVVPLLLALLFIH